MESTSNYKKHTNSNPVQRMLISNFYNSLLDLIKNLDSESILDVGCGEGYTLAKLKESGIGKKLDGVDNLDQAIETGKRLFKDISLKKGDIYKLDYKDNSFDLVICTEVLEHLEFPEKALREMRRVSRKHILLSVPNEPYFMLANFLRGKNISRWGNDIEHINHWSSKSFVKLLVKNDVKIIFVKTPFPWVIVLTHR